MTCQLPWSESLKHSSGSGIVSGDLRLRGKKERYLTGPDAGAAKLFAERMAGGLARFDARVPPILPGNHLNAASSAVRVESW
jgi:hypothetical protein